MPNAFADCHKGQYCICSNKVKAATLSMSATYRVYHQKQDSRQQGDTGRSPQPSNLMQRSTYFSAPLEQQPLSGSLMQTLACCQVDMTFQSLLL